MEFVLPGPVDRRPPAATLRRLRSACAAVISDPRFAEAFGVRIAELVPPDHLLRSEHVPVGELAVAVLDPIRDPERYGGTLEQLEARWYQLGAWLAELGMPDDACHQLVRAVARAARDVSGDDWDAAASSGWAALQLWTEAALRGGAEGVAGGPADPAAREAPPPGNRVD